MKHALPPYSHIDPRVLLGGIETEMDLWSRGYEEIAQQRLDQLLRSFQKAMTVTIDSDENQQLQTMMHQLETLHHALLRSEPVDQQAAQALARQIVAGIHAFRLARTSVLKPVAVEDAVGAHVIHFNYGLSSIGQIVRFRPADRGKRAFGFIGEVVMRPADEQKALKTLFQEIYLTGGDFLFFSDLYHWPANFPPQTFLEPGRPKDLVMVQWASHHVKDDDELESSEEEISPIVKTIRQGDRRIGMPVFSIAQQMGGPLDSIQVHADGGERWIARRDDGKQMIDESSLFWLETRDYRHLFPKRVLSQDAIYQHLREALALSKEQAELRDQDEIIQRHQRLDRVLTFLCGDLEDEPKRWITTIYQQMVWSSASLSAAQREAEARRTAAQIDHLRRMQPE